MGLYFFISFDFPDFSRSEEGRKEFAKERKNDPFVGAAQFEDFFANARGKEPAEAEFTFLIHDTLTSERNSRFIERGNGVDTQ